MSGRSADLFEDVAVNLLRHHVLDLLHAVHMANAIEVLFH